MPSTEIRIGRDDKCFISLADGKASRVHASLLATKEGIVVTDLGSSNGTFVDQSRLGVEPVVVRPGGRFRIGDTVLILKPAEE